MLQAHCGFDSVLGLGAAGGDHCWLVAPWWQTWEHLTHLISALHSSMPVPPMRGHLPCRDTCLDTEVSVECRYYCIDNYGCPTQRIWSMTNLTIESLSTEVQYPTYSPFSSQCHIQLIHFSCIDQLPLFAFYFLCLTRPRVHTVTAWWTSASFSPITNTILYMVLI